MIIPTVISLFLAFSQQSETNEGSNVWSKITTTQNNNVAQVQKVRPTVVTKTKINKVKPRIEQVKKVTGNDNWETYEITQYVATGNKTSSGRYPRGGRTAASNFLPQGTIIYIEGLGQRVVEDTGSKWALRENVIDVYIDGSRQDAREFGRQERKVKIIKWGE